uniref:Uncharacterized protein n=1 Tax=Pogona vitticeps TaxID=103695 RepID=A0ABM5GM04_9SAUR
MCWFRSLLFLNIGCFLNRAFVNVRNNEANCLLKINWRELWLELDQVEGERKRQQPPVKERTAGREKDDNVTSYQHTEEKDKMVAQYISWFVYTLIEVHLRKCGVGSFLMEEEKAIMQSWEPTFVEFQTFPLFLLYLTFSPLQNVSEDIPFVLKVLSETAALFEMKNVPFHNVRDFLEYNYVIQDELKIALRSHFSHQLTTITVNECFKKMKIFLNRDTHCAWQVIHQDALVIFQQLEFYIVTSQLN